MIDETQKELQTFTADDVGALPPEPTPVEQTINLTLNDRALEQLRDLFRRELWNHAERMQGEIAREIRVLLGEEQYDQRIFTSQERLRRVEAMQRCAALQTSDVERHESWMQMHVEQGWVYGEEFSPTAKTHPNLKPWDELPASTRSKARIFDICARYAAGVAEMLG